MRRVVIVPLWQSWHILVLFFNIIALHTEAFVQAIDRNIEILAVKSVDSTPIVNDAFACLWWKGDASETIVFYLRNELKMGVSKFVIKKWQCVCVH